MDTCLQKMNITSHTMQDWSQVTKNTPAEAIDYMLLPSEQHSQVVRTSLCLFMFTTITSLQLESHIYFSIIEA